MAAMTLDGLTAQLQLAFGPALTAVVLYGSAARGERVEGRSDLNVLVVVRELSPAALRAAAAAADAWSQAGHAPPLILTDAEWRSSRDVFAMEHADIAARHSVLAGALPDLPAPDAAHLRHQLEFEAMGKLIHFRQGVLACAGDAKREIELLLASKSAILVLFRALLRVAGDAVPETAEEVIRRAAARGGFDPAPFLEVQAHARGLAKIDKARADAVLAAYHRGLEQLVAHVDRLSRPA